MMLHVAKTETKYFPANRPVLPEWTRYAWSNESERQWWQTIVKEIGVAWHHAERYAVAEGYRSACFQPCTQHELFDLTQWARTQNLIVVPVERQMVSQGYSSATSTFDATKQWQYRVLIMEPDLLRVISNGYDNRILGNLLGYPKCCIDMFERTWAQGQIDSTWDAIMQNNSAEGDYRSNIFWRWLGPRLVSHLPCSFDCRASITIGSDMELVLEMFGYREEVRSIKEILSWPVQYSARNGIALIEGPCVKISTRTDWSPEFRQIVRSGASISVDASLWVDNGFGSAEAMRNAHKTIINAIVPLLVQGEKVIDLGCGNGMLLRRLKQYFAHHVKIGGIDINENALPKNTLSSSWLPGSIESLTWQTLNPDVVIFMPGRLQEMTEIDKQRVREAISQVPKVVVYSYNDWQKESLTDLCVSVGLPAPIILNGSEQVQLGIINRT